MKKLSSYLTFSLIIIALIIGIGIGYYITPQYNLSMYEKTTMDLGRPDKWLDLRYINEMISHHQGAIKLAEQARASQREEIKNLAEEIIKNEPTAIAELYAWKKSWFNDSKIITNTNNINLGTYNENFDLRFLNALISHHENGILMAKEVRLKTNRSEILDNADAVEKFLSDSGKMLKDWRKSWYNL